MAFSTGREPMTKGNETMDVNGNGSYMDEAEIALGVVSGGTGLVGAVAVSQATGLRGGHHS